MPHSYLFTSLRPLLKPSPSVIMKSILQTIERIAVSDIGVLIVGEQGTEKEWLARMIHQMSSRADKNFIHVDCSSLLPEKAERVIFGCEELSHSGVEIHRGVIENAYRGTLFLENLSALSPTLQVKITRVLEHQHLRRYGGFEQVGVNVRLIISLSMKPSELSWEDGSIGKESLYRICPMTMNIPPLRERREDILYLIEEYIQHSLEQEKSYPKGITAQALNTCLQYDWPGNAVELKKVIEHVMVTCSERFIRKSHLPGYLHQQFGQNKNSIAIEKIGNP
jgi:DNA-binding NtrC family response regulator